MKYAKYIDTKTIESAPPTITVGDISYTGTIPDSVYRGAGYYPFIESAPPVYDPTYQYLDYEYKLVDGGEVQKIWTINKRDVEDVRAEKLAEINVACEQTIYSGVDVETTKGTEHFSLSANDQINIAFYEQQIVAGATHVPYHADGKLCRMYTADEMRAVISASTKHKVYHLTYCNHLREYVSGLSSPANISKVTYGQPLNATLQSSLNSILVALGGE